MAPVQPVAPFKRTASQPRAGGAIAASAGEARACIAALLASAVLALAGCGGGSVAVRSGLAAPPPPSGGTYAGLSISGGGGFAAALVLGLIIVDGVYWTASQLQQDAADPVAPAAQRWLLQPIDRGWVDRGP